MGQPRRPGVSEGPASRSRGGTWIISLAARLYRSSAVHFGSLPPSCLQHGMWPQSPSLSRFLPGAPIPASRSFIAFPSVPVRVPVSAVRARNLGAVRRRLPVSVLVFLCSLARPPVALTWAPQGCSPSKAVAARAAGSTVRQRKNASCGTRSAGHTTSAGTGGMWRFNTEDSPGLKVGPVPVLVMSLLFIASVFMLHIWGKYTRS